jgi:hypothetical protein
MQNSKKGIQKYHLWLAFFFLIFGGTFSMIVWTVKSAVETPVYDDKSFLSSYHDVDDNFNKMMVRNHHFNTLYDVQIKVNDKVRGMEIKDAFLGQRSLEKQSNNQNMLKVGNNSISIVVTDKKNSQIVSDANVSFQITRAIEDMYDIDLNTFTYENDTYSTNAKIDLAGNWNIYGTIKVLDEIGYLYIKTNTQK